MFNFDPVVRFHDETSRFVSSLVDVRECLAGAGGWICSETLEGCGNYSPIK